MGDIVVDSEERWRKCIVYVAENVVQYRGNEKGH